MAGSQHTTTLQRPYLLRAMHEWMTDNDLTPHIVIDVAAAETALPTEYVKDGKLVINISYSATQNLTIGNESASFAARFSGVSRHLDVPIMAIAGIYARETGQGMIFSSETGPQDEAPDAGDADSQAAEAAEAQDNAEAQDDSGGRERSRPRLTIIK